MKYVLLIYSNPATWAALAPQEADRILGVHNDLMQELGETGEFVSIYRMADASNVRTVRQADGVPAVTDGPFGEAKELLASAWELDCDSTERAVEIATPLADGCTVEVWPLMDDAGFEM